MGLDIRSITEDELRPYMRSISTGFGSPEVSDEEYEHYSATTELDRTIAVFDRGDIVATAGAFTFDMTLPGPAPTPVGGVTAVTVATTHRRQGVLTRMMRHQLEDVRNRGEALAALTASEGVIYGRFGYGIASFATSVTVSRDRARFERPVEDTGRLRFVDTDAAAKLLPDLHDRSRRRAVGDISRRDTWWKAWLKDPKFERNGASARFYVVHESAKGKADGYATYRMKGAWEAGFPNAEVMVGDVVADDPVVYARLWRHLLDVDLAVSIQSYNRPVDDPLRWLLADPRQLRTDGVRDFLWLRPVDMAGALAARSYATEDEIVLEVDDGFCPWNTGRYALQASSEGATCTRTKKRADLALGAREVGSLLLGGTTPSTLARSGAVDELRAGALRRADAVFRADAAPYCRTGF